MGECGATARSAWGLYSAYRFIRFRKTSYADQLRIVDAIVSLYVIGMGFKMGLIGHWFFRWYLPDIGFPAMEGFVFFWVVMMFVSRTERFRQMEVYEQWLRVVRYRRNTLVVALVMSYLYELATSGMYALSQGHPVRYVGKTDPWGLVCYTVGGGIALACYAVTMRNIKRDQALAQAYVAQQQAAQQAARQRTKRVQPKRASRVARRR